MKNMKIDANGTEIRVMGDIVNEDGPPAKKARSRTRGHER